MTLKNKLILAILGLSLAFVAGRYTNQVTETSHSQVTSNEDKNVQKDTHDKVITTITEKPDGEKQTTITETKDVISVTQDDKHSVSVVDTSKITGSSPKTTVSALAAIDIHTKLPTYGASISHELIGPISVGVFGLTSGVAGVSLGITF